MVEAVGLSEVACDYGYAACWSQHGRKFPERARQKMKFVGIDVSVRLRNCASSTRRYVDDIPPASDRTTRFNLPSFLCLFP